MPRDPLLDRRFAVIAFGEDVGDPDGGQPAVGESLVEMMSSQMPIEDRGEVELLGQADQQGDVVDAFVDQGQGLGHGRSLPEVQEGHRTVQIPEIKEGHVNLRRIIPHRLYCCSANGESPGAISWTKSRARSRRTTSSRRRTSTL